MVMKKPVVKAKPARSAAREIARPKAVAKKSAPAPAKKIVPTKALRTQTGVKATAKAVAKPAAVPAKPLPTVTLLRQARHCVVVRAASRSNQKSS